MPMTFYWTKAQFQMLLIAKSWSYGLQVAGMTKEKTQWKEFLETISVLQWVLTFLLLGKIPLHSPYMILYIRYCCSCISSPVYWLWNNADIWANFRMSCFPRHVDTPNFSTVLHYLDGVSSVYLAVAALHSLLHVDGDGLGNSWER